MRGPIFLGGDWSPPSGNAPRVRRVSAGGVGQSLPVTRVGEASMRPADRAWVALAVGVAVYEALAPRGELLSQGAARYRERRPVVTHGVIVYVAAHLAGVWPRRVDPLHRLASALGR